MEQLQQPLEVGVDVEGRAHLGPRGRPQPLDLVRVAQQRLDGIREAHRIARHRECARAAGLDGLVVTQSAQEAVEAVVSAAADRELT